MTEPNHPTNTCALLGAADPVGRRLVDRLSGAFRLVGLIDAPSRREALDGSVDAIRIVDPFSYRELRDALADVDQIVWTLQPTRPADGWTQSTPAALDLLAAANVAAAADHGSVGQITLVGTELALVGSAGRGASMREVVDVAASGETPTTTLLADAAAGPGTLLSSTVRAVARGSTPPMFPEWCRERRRLVAVADIASVVEKCVTEPTRDNRRIRLAPRRRSSPLELLAAADTDPEQLESVETTRGDWPRLSAWWLSRISGHDRVRMRALVDLFRTEPTGLEETTVHDVSNADPRRLLGGDDEPTDLAAAPDAPPARSRTNDRIHSVQVFRSETGWTADRLAEEYFDWLGRTFRPFLRVDFEHGTVALRPRLLSVDLLVLEAAPTEQPASRRIYRITDGLLAEPSEDSQFEFHAPPRSERVVVALRGYRTALPWLVYRWTQALVHRLVMWLFGLHLAHLRSGESASQ